MAELFASGRIVDVILALMVVEMLVVTIVRWRTGRGIAVVDFIATLAPGVALLLAFRAHAGSRDWTAAAAWLAVALVAHLADLARRWKR